MSPQSVSLFDPPLAPDPAICLPAPQVAAPDKPGPLHRVQFTIELVGPRSVPAVQAARLLDADWFPVLGDPYLFAMRPSDNAWRALDSSTDGSYDSLALAWDYLSAQGALSTASVRKLLSTAEGFAQGISRRALPLPPAEDVDAAVAALIDIRNNLDVGVGLSVAPDTGAVAERDLWVVCSRMGLTFSPSGSFDWTASRHPSPLLSVTPIGTTEAFSLGSVQRGEAHEGVSLGFNVPLCPTPAHALEGLFRVAEELSSAIGGRIYDDSGELLDEDAKNEMRSNLSQVVGLLERAGLAPGSAETLRLFS